MIKGLIHLDHVLNFGASTAPGIWGRVADAMVRLFLHQRIEAVIKWVDDFVFVRYPIHRHVNGQFQYTYTMDLIWKVTEELGWPWALAKFVDFMSAFTYIGFWWNFSVKTVELPEKKKTKYLEWISGWTLSSSHMAKEADKIIGTLNHVSLVIPEGCSHLVLLYKFCGGFKADLSGEAKHKLSKSITDDIQWWQQQLEEEFVGMKIVCPPTPSDHQLFIDASTRWGIGLLLNGKWLAWQLKDGWKADGRDIGWAEMVAVELAIQTLVTAKFANCHIVIHSDNKGVMSALAVGRSRKTQQNAILWEIVKLIQDHDIWILMTWVATHDNPVDKPSRGVFSG
jgi:hypothetical protein